MEKTITVETIVHADISAVWKAWITPEDIVQWMHAEDSWECPKAENDVKVGGHFSFIFAAKDKSASFDFNGVYTAVVPNELLAYTIEGGRTVTVAFADSQDGVRIAETFEMETQNTEEKQRAGWQAILNNFKAHVEGATK